MTFSPGPRSSLTLPGAAKRDWDVVVLGAGPAGAMTARQCALAKLRVLMIDRTTFPRDKVCGCCLNGAALDALKQVGLESLASDLSAHRLTSFEVFHGPHHLALPLATGVSLSRASLDAHLIHHALEAGVEFLDQTEGKVLAAHPVAKISLRSDGEEQHIEPRCTVVATGLGARGTEQIQTAPKHQRHQSLIGMGTVLDTNHKSYAVGSIYMGIGAGGYVGLVRLEDGRLDIASAMTKSRIQRYGNVREAIASLMNDCHLPSIPELTHARWKGTPPLTQHPMRLQYDSVFITGDAAGYIEPFTGEGIGWALASGISLAPHVIHRVSSSGVAPTPSWEATYRRLVGHRQSRCRWVARGLRHPWLVHCAFSCLRFHPALARRFQEHLNRPIRMSD